ncbi:MAG TPA: YitT family protein [Paludibacteraceae bacterium]|nr:YitT family protein [Paludibacteraceae bacterium]HOJ66718.1 YitT family protein [Paludibacteraceae bacterium]HOL29903.1 YitT family protein [Paludibacteraceae bacterium]HON03013.1 YitT family protein [Paludibacteraceae bacterium]HPD59937.1 YitT family protein [Paludibacteraceae bacterium]
MAKFNPFTKKNWIFIRQYILITIGLFMYAAAWKGFLLPHQITGGGVTGIGAIVYYATGVPIFITYFVINALLIAVALRIIGFQFSLRTIYGVAMITLFFAVLPQADPGTFVAPNDNFMACLLGGLISGTGLGIVFLNNGSSGGTDIIAKIVNKYYNITLGRILLYCDVLIICSSYFFEFGTIEKIVYGLTNMAISNLAIDMVINGVRQSVQFFIFSKEYEQIANRINTEVHRGVTILDGTGWYSQQPVKVITVIARKNESSMIFRIVKEIDPDAFVSQSSVIAVYGKGFDVIKSK